MESAESSHLPWASTAAIKQHGQKASWETERQEGLWGLLSRLAELAGYRFHDRLGLKNGVESTGGTHTSSAASEHTCPRAYTYPAVIAHTCLRAYIYPEASAHTCPRACTCPAVSAYTCPHTYIYPCAYIYPEVNAHTCPRAYIYPEVNAHTCPHAYIYPEVSVHTYPRACVQSFVTASLSLKISHCVLKMLRDGLVPVSQGE